MDLWENVKRAVRDVDFDLRRHVVPKELPSRQMLGHAGVHRPRLNLADYIEPEASAPPGVHRSHLEFDWGMLLNDQLGDCGEAMALHGVEAFHLDAGTPVPPFSDGDAERFYSLVGGYVPGDPSTDNGTDNQVLVDKWEQVGINCRADHSNHKIVASVFVDPQDDRVSKIAIWEFVVLFRALGLPLTAQGQDYWRLTDPSLQGAAALGSWGYHDIPYLSYDNRRLRNVSWSVPMLVDWDFDRAYAVGGFVVISREQLNLRGVSPSGVNWTKLNTDLQQFVPQPQG